MTGKLNNNLQGQSGQAFLLIILFVSIAITVALATSFKAITETQTTKSQEDSTKAVAAADAGAEYALKNMSGAEPYKTYAQIPISIPGIDAENSSVIVSVDPAASFVSPILKKDGQYTFYAGSYDSSTGSIANSIVGNLYIDYGSGNTNCNTIALEISLLESLSSNQYQVERYVADTGGLFTENMKNIGSAGTHTVDGTTFNCRASFINTPSIPTTTKLIIVRYLTKGNAETKLGFTAPSSVLPAQGKMVIARAVTTSGIKKEVVVLQSYPQIPAEFFVTSF